MLPAMTRHLLAIALLRRNAFSLLERAASALQFNASPNRQVQVDQALTSVLLPDP